MDVGVEQLLAVEADTVRHADVAHVTATASALDRLHHRLLRTDTLQHRVRADSIGQLLDSLHTLITAFSHDFRRAEFARELLPRLMAAHRNDPLSAHLLR